MIIINNNYKLIIKKWRITPLKNNYKKGLSGRAKPLTASINNNNPTPTSLRVPRNLQQQAKWLPRTQKITRWLLKPTFTQSQLLTCQLKRPIKLPIHRLIVRLAKTNNLLAHRTLLWIPKATKKQLNLIKMVKMLIKGLYRRPMGRGDQI